VKKIKINKMFKKKQNKLQQTLPDKPLATPPPPNPPVKVIGREGWQEFHVHITEFQVV